VTLAATAALFAPRLTASPVWRATVTPLASIVGSGFLVSFPLLTHDLGFYALIAMAGLAVFAYPFGGAIRFNILHGEPLLFAKDGRGWLAFPERSAASGSTPARLSVYRPDWHRADLVTQHFWRHCPGVQGLRYRGVCTAAFLALAAMALGRRGVRHFHGRNLI
jgi:hypothetical protein